MEQHEEKSSAKDAKLTSLPKRIAEFVRETVSELRRVVWPTRSQVVTYSTVVLVFVVVLSIIVNIFDVVIGQGVLALFGE
jgi:preprotein translocase subunit SecE